MNKLFLDIGNTRVKRAVIIDGDYEVLAAVGLNNFLTEDGFDCLYKGKRPDAVYMTSVVSHEHLEQIKSLIHEHCQLFPVQLTSQRNSCGLSSGYKDFHKLGDDRWMAMQGAFGFYKDPIIVISAGTAMTIDAIMDAKHLGGFIVPGLESLRASLANDTGALPLIDGTRALEEESSDPTLLPSNTESAILGGTLYMTASYINTFITDLNEQLQTQFRVIVTGGNASQLCPLIDSNCEHIPDLVLQGMVNIEESVKKN